MLSFCQFLFLAPEITTTTGKSGRLVVEVSFLKVVISPNFILVLCVFSFNSTTTSANGKIVLLTRPPKYRKLDELKIKTPKNHAFACHICIAWCNCSYTMKAKPMKILELHYKMIQSLIIMFII